MTRDDIILRLLAASGAVSRSDLVQDTGWGITDTNAVVDALLAAGKVVPFPAYGNNHRHGASKLLCLPAARAEAVLRAKAENRR